MTQAIDYNTLSAEDLFSSPEFEGKLRFFVIDRTGDTRHVWDPSKPAEVTAARDLFVSLTDAGYLAHRVTDKKGEAGELVRTFNPSDGKLLFTPPMVGG